MASELGKSFLVVYQLARNGVDQGSAGRGEPSSSRDVRGPPRMRTKNCFGKGRTKIRSRTSEDEDAENSFLDGASKILTNYGPGRLRTSKIGKSCGPLV